MPTARVLSEENVQRAGGQSTDLLASLILNDSAATGLTVADALTALAGGAGALRLTRVFVVDPANPAAYATIQSAIDAAAATGTTGVFLLNPGTSYVENLSVPPGWWELQCPALSGINDAASGLGPVGAAITGNITHNAGNLSVLTITNCRVSGNLTANVGAIPAHGASLRLKNTDFPGSVTCNAGAGFYSVFADGYAGVPYASVMLYRLGAVNIPNAGGGFLSVRGCSVVGDQAGAFNPAYEDCSFSAAVTSIGSSSSLLRLIRCVTAASVALAVTGTVQVDALTMQSLLARGATGAGVVSLLDANAAADTGVIAGNVAATNFVSQVPAAGLYRIDAELEITTTGTAGTAQINAIFTDNLGAATIAITGASGVVTSLTRGQGSRVFYSTGASQIQYSITGVTTPGALQMRARLNLRRLS